MGVRDRTDHAESAARARAFLRFVQARRDMLQAMHEWIALHPTAGHAQDEADSTVSAVRQIGALGYTQPNRCRTDEPFVLEASRGRGALPAQSRPLTNDALPERSNG